MASDPTPNWLGAAVTFFIAFAGASWALVRRVLSSVTREEMERFMEQLEERSEKRFEDVQKTILALHEDNRDARHRLRQDINTPITTLTTEIVKLRKSIDGNDSGSNYRGPRSPITR